MESLKTYLVSIFKKNNKGAILVESSVVFPLILCVLIMIIMFTLTLYSLGVSRGMAHNYLETYGEDFVENNGVRNINETELSFISEEIEDKLKLNKAGFQSAQVNIEYEGIHIHPKLSMTIKGKVTNTYLKFTKGEIFYHAEYPLIHEPDFIRKVEFLKTLKENGS